MRVIALQMNIAWEDAAANRVRVATMLESALPRGGELVVLPEMFASGFTMNVDLASDRDETTRMFLQQIAKKFKITIVAGMVRMSSNGRGRNEAVVIGPDGKEIACYCKMHPFSIGDEDRHYHAGDSIVTFPWAGFTAAPFVCYDLRFPEIFRAAAVRHHADLLIVIANWPSKRAEHWVTLLKARAIENQAYVIGVNRCGSDPQHLYPGRSMVIDPHGNPIVDAGEHEGFIEADIDAQIVHRWREEFPVLRDARHLRGNSR